MLSPPEFNSGNRLRLQRPDEAVQGVDADTSPPLDTEKLRTVLDASGRLLNDGLSFLRNAWVRLPRVKVQLWRDGADLRSELEGLWQRHAGPDTEVGSFLLRCGRWGVDVRLLLVDAEAGENPKLMDMEPLLMDLQDLLANDPEGQSPEPRVLADAILLLAETTAEGFKTLAEGQMRLEGRMDGLEGRMDGLEGRMGGLEGRMDRLETHMKALRNDVGVIKGSVVIRATRDLCFFVTEDTLALDTVHILNRTDLLAILRPLAPALDRSERDSFYKADLVAECENRDDGARAYVAVEASYTADLRDSDRALRNARLLTQCTGIPAHALVASVRNVREVQALVDRGELHWYRLTENDLQPD